MNATINGRIVMSAPLPTAPTVAPLLLPWESERAVEVLYVSWGSPPGIPRSTWRAIVSESRDHPGWCRRASGILVVAGVDVGAVISVCDSTGEAGTGLVAYLGVVPWSWGYGLGGVLCRYAMRGLSAAGQGRVALGVDPQDVRAIRMYRRCGFTEIE